MRRTMQTLPISLNRARRSGATLIEILMTLMILGLGITSVFSLFPMSLVRSIRANQQTNASLVYQNAAEMVNGEVVEFDTPSHPAPHTGTFVFDPYGHDGFTASQTAMGATNGVPRVPPVGIVAADYDDYFSSADSWFTVDGVPEELPSSVTGNTVTFPTDYDLSNIGTNSRVVIYSSDRSISAAINVTSAASNVLTLESNVPASIAGSFGMARVETRDRRYMWLLSITGSGDGEYFAQCVVFFRRSFLPDEETTYGVTSVDARGRQIDVAVMPDAVDLSRGDYFFASHDVGGDRFGEWYQIVTIEEGATGYRLTLDRGFGAATGVAMFPTGVIGVFDMGHVHVHQH